MKRILFTGDSITRGALGCSYIDLLALEFPQYEFVNLGRDGDTVSGIMGRTINHLKENRAYDLIVISAGHNDIILPDFMGKSVIHRSIVKNLAEKGSIPAADISEFLATYNLFIRLIRDITSVPLIMATLSCLNENLASPTNTKREIYNRGIRTLVKEHNLILADVAGKFNDLLETRSCRDYFMNDLFASVFSDSRKSRTIRGAERLSKKRSLHLTIDGIHINSQGAEIYKEIISEHLRHSIS